MMKTLLFIFFLSYGYAFTQTIDPNSTNQKEVIESNSYPANTSESDSLKAISLFNEDINYQISLIDSHLNSIQIKWNYIIGNPEEKLLAEENGWFDDMTAIIASLQEKRQLLVDSLK